MFWFYTAMRVGQPSPAAISSFKARSSALALGSSADECERESLDLESLLELLATMRDSEANLLVFIHILTKGRSGGEDGLFRSRVFGRVGRRELLHVGLHEVGGLTIMIITLHDVDHIITQARVEL